MYKTVIKQDRPLSLQEVRGVTDSSLSGLNTPSLSLTAQRSALLQHHVRGVINTRTDFKGISMAFLFLTMSLNLVNTEVFSISDFSCK